MWVWLQIAGSREIGPQALQWHSLLLVRVYTELQYPDLARSALVGIAIKTPSPNCSTLILFYLYPFNYIKTRPAPSGSASVDCLLQLGHPAPWPMNPRPVKNRACTVFIGHSAQLTHTCQAQLPHWLLSMSCYLHQHALPHPAEKAVRGKPPHGANIPP